MWPCRWTTPSAGAPFLKGKSLKSPSHPAHRRRQGNLCGSMTGPSQDPNRGGMDGGTDTTDSGTGSGNAAGDTSGETSSSSSQMNLNRTPHGPREELFGKRKLQQHIDVRCCNLNVNARPGTTVSRYIPMSEEMLSACIPVVIEPQSGSAAWLRVSNSFVDQDSGARQGHHKDRQKAVLCFATQPQGPCLKIDVCAPPSDTPLGIISGKVKVEFDSTWVVCRPRVFVIQVECDTSANAANATAPIAPSSAPASSAPASSAPLPPSADQATIPRRTASSKHRGGKHNNRLEKSHIIADMLEAYKAIASINCRPTDEIEKMPRSWDSVVSAYTISGASSWAISSPKSADGTVSFLRLSFASFLEQAITSILQYHSAFSSGQLPDSRTITAFRTLSHLAEIQMNHHKNSKEGVGPTVRLSTSASSLAQFLDAAQSGNVSSYAAWFPFTEGYTGYTSSWNQQLGGSYGGGGQFPYAGGYSAPVTSYNATGVGPQNYYTGAYALQQQQQNQPYSAPWVPNSNQNYAFNSAQPYTTPPGYYPSASPYVSHNQSVFFTGQRAEGGVQQPAYSRQAVNRGGHVPQDVPPRPTTPLQSMNPSVQERDLVDGDGGSESIRRVDKGSMHVCAVGGDGAAIYGSTEKSMLRDFAVYGSFAV